MSILRNGDPQQVPSKALIIDDDPFTLDLFDFQFKSKGFQVTVAESGRKGIGLIGSENFDVIITDLNMPDMSGIELVKQAKELRPNTEVIVITGDDAIKPAVEATRGGAFDYLQKPVDFDRLFTVARNAVERKKEAQIIEHQAAEIERLKKRITDPTSFEGIIGGARSMQNIYEIIANVAESDANVLILGESGTGKEVIANAIHYRSHRAKEPFVKVNCSALPKDLIESHLFGHVKGSFTGAHSDKVGFIGQANGGSLLLDEIGEMPIDLQPKLLRILQERVYYRVGSDKPLEADFRLICSTNRIPFEAIADGTLREDLFYRINTIEIKIPPLRERMDDVPMLATHFLHEYAEQYDREGIEFSRSAYDQLLNYTWRGNVRELQHTIERAVLLSKSEKIERLDIPGSASVQMPAAHSVPVDNGGQSSALGVAPAKAPIEGANAHTLRPIATQFAALHSFSSDDPEEMFDEIGKLIVDRLPAPVDGEQHKDVFDRLEGGVVLAALKRTGGNKQAAANILGLYRPRLYGMIKRHRLDSKL